MHSSSQDSRSFHADLLVGIACADALGAATEFATPSQIADRFVVEDFDRFQPGSPFGFAPGEATDDSQMIVAHLLAGERPAEGFADWLGSNPPDVGNLTRDALQVGAHEAWRASGCRSAGNGGLMRVAAVFLQGWRGKELATRAVSATAVTHVDPRCIHASLFLVMAMERLAAGEELPAAVRDALASLEHLDPAELVEESGEVPPDQLHRWGLGTESYLLFRQAVEAGLAGESGPQSGYVLDTLQQALRHGAAGSWSGGIIPIVMAGDDSDTVAAVTAALLGARGLTAPEELAATVRLGASWPGWRSEWFLQDRAPNLVGDLR